jgi:hypothetical protein
MRRIGHIWRLKLDGCAAWVTLRNRGEPTAFATLATPILATAVRRATARDLTRLKSRDQAF